LADALSTGISPTPVSRIADIVLNAGSIWAGLAILSGYRARSLRGAALAGPSSLMAAVAAYYAFGVTFGDRAFLGLAAISPTVRVWAVIAVVVGPGLGVVGYLIRRPGATGLAAVLVWPAGAIIEMVVVRRLDLHSFAVDPVLAWTQAAVASIGMAVIVEILVLARRPAARSGTGG
jgi:hypothetical protein